MKVAQDKGISRYMNKQEVIEYLDELEPGIDHSDYNAKALIALKKKYNIGLQKNKNQLVRAIEKAVGKEYAAKISK